MGRQTRALTLREQLGQRIAVGFPGTELTEEFLDFLAEFKIGNLILFKRNIESAKQLKNLTRQLQQVVHDNTGHPAFLMVDQEGGPIVRLPQEAVNGPGAMALAATGDSENAYLAGQLTGRQLAAVGVNFDLAPVLDINCNPDNPVIGVRSYGDTPRQVASYGLAMMRGLLSQDVVPCVKHFPGHGDTREDSHLSLPVVDKPEEELWRMELAPFVQAVEEGVPAVMTSHVVYPALEPEGVPATMSKAIVTGLLREKLGYQGLVVSDSMEMAAIHKYYGISEGVLAAFRADVDIVLISHSMEQAKDAILMAERAVAQGDLNPEAVENSVERILSCKARFGEPKEGIELEAADRELEKRLIGQTYTAVRLPQGGLPRLGDRPFFTGCYAYQSSLVSNEDDLKLCFPEWLANAFGGDSFVFSPDPSEEEIDRLLARAAGCSCIVAGTYNGHLRKGQRQLLEKLSALGIPMAVFALRNPYELLGLPETVAAIAVWEYSVRSLEGIRDMLEGRILPEGKFPISVLPGRKADEYARNGVENLTYYKNLETEKVNPRTREIDLCDTVEMLHLINREDARVAEAVKAAIPQIAKAVDAAHNALKQGGHMIYLGAGTSGRLGVLDASECVPTYGVEPDLVQGFIAGGDKALRTAVEGCEDSRQLGEALIVEKGITGGDVVVGISASGTAPFVDAALAKAREIGAVTVAIVNNPDSGLKKSADICIEALTGPEVVSGSTRMKAGTAQKMILNMLSTGVMIKMGRVYKNWMVDLKASNIKLEDRARRIFCDVTGKGVQEAEQYLKAAGMDTKLAIMMCLSGLGKDEAQERLRSCNGFLKQALEQ